MDIEHENKVRGVFQGEGERAYNITVKSDDDKALRGFMATIGKQYGQDQVASFTPDPDGPDYKYRLHMAKPEDAVDAASKELGFASASADALEYWGKPEDADRVKELAAKLKADVEVIPGHATFLDSKDYDAAIRDAQG